MAWRTVSRSIPTGNAGNRATIRAMSALAAEGASSPLVIEAAQNAIRGTPERDDEVDFAAVLEDVRRRMRYTHDPLNAEVVKSPAYVIARTNDPESSPEPMDCDDASVLCASMLGALGYPTRFVTVAADPTRPKEWSHVYVAARRNNGRWVALDPIVRSFGVGDEVPASRITARVYHEGASPMSRLGCYGPRCARLSGLGEEAIDPSLVAMQTSNPYGSGAESARVSYSGTTSGGTSWWERLFSAGSTAAARVVAARNPASVRIVNRAPAKPGFFTKPDGTTDWTKVTLVGAGVAIGGALLVKLAKGR